MNDPNDPLATTRSPRWPWLCLALAMVWVALVRVPLVMNADAHLDSDLAVDGLTLIEATQGQWRLHFPGTPYMGTPPVWLSVPGAKLFGANSRTLVVGGVIAYELVVLATFFLAWRTFGPSVAAWSLVPTTFASVGIVWLSGRLTGGHLLTVAWHASALAMIPRFRDRGGYLRALGFGVWCGLGYYLDGMSIMTLPFVGLLLVKEVVRVDPFLRKILLLVCFAFGFAVGDLPREIGIRADPRDAYPDQFATILDRDPAGNFPGEQFKELFLGHLDILGRECLPRLITGHRFNSSELATEPRPYSLAIAPPRNVDPPSRILTFALVALATFTFLASIVVLFGSCFRVSEFGVISVPWAILSSSFLCVAFFVLNKNIYNSDNYRYLVYLIVPWSIGFGLLASRLWNVPKAYSASRKRLGRVGALLIAGGIAGGFTLDTLAWYRGFGWVEASGLPVRRNLDDPALEWLRTHREIPGFFGGYWDVYRYQFLLGGKPVGVPFPNYPDRYDSAQDFENRQPRVMVARKGELGNFYIDTARNEGANVLLVTPERLIMDWTRSR